jgi:fucose 4-O-acetylase-like acetyltransferase
MKNLKTDSVRSNYFDNIKGFLIILVVLGHLLEDFLNLEFIKYFYILIFSFHIPLFVFCSGYFSTNTNFKKIITRIVYPYIVFQTLYFFFNKYVLNNTGVSFNFINPFWTLWYLLSLTFWSVIVNSIKKVNIRFILITFLIGLLVGFVDFIDHRLSLSRTIVFFPFFLLGFYCNKNKIDFNIFKKNKLFIAIVSFLSVIILLGLYIYIKDINIMWFYSFLSYTSLGYNFFIRLGIYLVALILSAMIMIVVPNSKIYKITNIGISSMVVYLFHGFIIRYLEKTFHYEILSSNIKIISYLIVTTVVIVLVLSSKYVTVLFKKVFKR